jgi:hypothetical protein
MKTTELVRHAVSRELEQHDKITDEQVIRSISTKLADPRLTQVELSPEPFATLAQTVAESMYRIDWEQTPISNIEQTRSRIVEAVLLAYADHHNIEVPHQSPVEDTDTDDTSADEPTVCDKDGIVEASPSDIDTMGTYYDDDDDEPDDQSRISGVR